MTMPAGTDTIVVAEGAAAPATPTHHVDWSAIIGGIVLASAIALVMLSFGSAIGLSFVNFHGGANVSPIWVAIAAVSWLLWVLLSAMMSGGYLAGRLRRRVHDATEHESDVRDGAHGLLVWAGALLVGAVITSAGIGAALSAIGGAASTATNAAATAAAPATGAAAGAVSGNGFNPTSYFTDALFRPAPTTTPAATAAPAAATTPAPAADTATTPAPSATTPAMSASATPAARAQASAEAGRILASGAVNGSISDEDKNYLAQLVAQNTGMSAADAKTRVDTVLANVDAAKQKAADAAETARKTGVLAAFLTAAALLVSAAGAYWAASLGGRHRDEQTVFADFFRRY